VSPHIKLVAEAGHMGKRPDGSGTQRLTKLTLAPTWSAGPGFSDRPDLRLYVTTARWNDAANAGAGAAGLTGLSDGAMRGTNWACSSKPGSDVRRATTRLMHATAALCGHRVAGGLHW
jgi:maltoporin